MLIEYTPYDEKSACPLEEALFWMRKFLEKNGITMKVYRDRYIKVADTNDVDELFVLDFNNISNRNFVACYGALLVLLSRMSRSYTSIDVDGLAYITIASDYTQGEVCREIIRMFKQNTRVKITE